MGAITENEIKDQIKTGKFSNLYLIYGNEAYLKQFYCGKIMEKSVRPDFAVFNLHIFDAQDTDFRDVMECCEGLPMMDERKCVVVKDIDLSKQDGAKSEILYTMISDVPESTVLIFWMQNVEVDIKKNPKWKKIFEKFSKYGDILELDKKSLSQLRQIIIKGAKKRGKIISSSLADYFISTVGDELSVLLNELEKLCFYCKSDTVEKQDIDQIVTKNVESSVYDLAKQIISGRRDDAFKNLSYLISRKTDPISISSALIGAYVDMYRAKVFVTSGFPANECAKYYNYKNRAFRLNYAVRDASKLDLTALRRSLDILSQTDINLKSTSYDKRILLEETIVKLMLVSGGEKV